MTPTTLAKIAEEGDHLEFADEELRGETVTGVGLDHCLFRRVGLKRVAFQGGSIQHSFFLDSYLRYTTFEAVDLTGTRFENCNLRHAVFDRCRLWYVRFYRCDLDYSSLLDNLPHEVNLRRHLLRSLRLNAAATGDTPMANRLLLLEMQAEREEQSSIVRARTPYFSNNFTLGDRITAFFNLVAHYLQLAIWGYGVRIRSLLRAGVVLVLLSALLHVALGSRFYTPPESTERAIGFWEALYVSVVTFSTLGFGGIAPASAIARVIASAGSVAGAIFVGLFAAAAYRRIRR